MWNTNFSLTWRCKLLQFISNCLQSWNYIRYFNTLLPDNALLHFLLPRELHNTIFWFCHVVSTKKNGNHCNLTHEGKNKVNIRTFTLKTCFQKFSVIKKGLWSIRQAKLSIQESNIWAGFVLHKRNKLWISIRKLRNLLSVGAWVFLHLLCFVLFFFFSEFLGCRSSGENK